MKWTAIILTYTGWESEPDWDDACHYERKEFNTQFEAENWAEEFINNQDLESMGGTPIQWDYRILPPDYDGTW